jgi:SAM-dependent methyltransferase
MNMPDHVRENKAGWEVEAANYAEPARRDWAASEISWGIYRVPESDVGALPDVAGMDVVELGCGTAYFSAWLARRGARPIGVDVAENQLATARAMQAEHRLEFPLIQANAEDVPLPDDCADLVLSEYGASLWCEPDAWLGEASRLLRPAGHLVFLTTSVIVALTAPADGGPNDDLLVRGQREIETLRFEGEAGVEFHLSHGDWIAALARHGFTVTGLHELYAPDGAEPTRFDWMTIEWARRWPVEELWTARLRASA